MANYRNNDCADATFIFHPTTHDRNCGIPMNYIDIFLEALSAEKGRSTKTLASYESDLRLADSGIPGGLMHADQSAIQCYLSALPDKPSSIARKASALRGFYKFLMLEKIITKNPRRAQNVYPGSNRRLSMKRMPLWIIPGQRTPYRVYFTSPSSECQGRIMQYNGLFVYITSKNPMVSD